MTQGSGEKYHLPEAVEEAAATNRPNVTAQTWSLSCTVQSSCQGSGEPPLHTVIQGSKLSCLYHFQPTSRNVPLGLSSEVSWKEVQGGHPVSDLRGYASHIHVCSLLGGPGHLGMPNYEEDWNWTWWGIWKKGWANGLSHSKVRTQTGLNQVLLAQILYLLSIHHCLNARI